MRVKYFDIEIEVPKWTRFLATDSDGTVVAFEDRPHYDSDRLWAVTEGTKYKELFRDFYYNGNWKKSVVEYEVIYEMASELQEDIRSLINRNKMAWQHIVKICCYKDRTDDIDAQRDLFKHVDDIVKTFSSLQRSYITKAILKKQDKEIVDYLTKKTEESLRKQNITSLVKEYRKEVNTAFINKVLEYLRDIYKLFIADFVRTKREITLKGFRNILQTVGVFNSGELNDIFRNHQDLLD